MSFYLKQTTPLVITTKTGETLSLSGFNIETIESGKQTFKEDDLLYIHKYVCDEDENIFFFVQFYVTFSSSELHGDIEVFDISANGGSIVSSPSFEFLTEE